MNVYLSGPITNTPNYRNNFLAAEGAVEERGHSAVNPVSIKACDDQRCEPKVRPGDPHSWGCYMKHDIQAMLSCDAIAMMPGWEYSHGARLELLVASSCGLEVIMLTPKEMEANKW